MTKDALYTLNELAQAAGISPRAIRFYTSEGLLPGPQARGRFALYGPPHLARLRLIALLKAALMPLARMRDHLPRLTDAQVASLLTGAGATPDAWEQASQEAGFALDADAVGTPLATQEEAYRALSSALRARSQPDAAPTTITAQGKKIQANQGQAGKGQAGGAQADSRKTRRALLVSSRLLASDREQNGGTANADAADNPSAPFQDRMSKIEDPDIESSDTWQRILLAPGVELHVRTPDTPRGREQLDHAIAHARSLFQL